MPSSATPCASPLASTATLPVALVASTTRPAKVLPTRRFALAPFSTRVSPAVPLNAIVSLPLPVIVSLAL